MRFEPTFHTRNGDPTGSLCQSCQKAVPSGDCRCSWSDHFEPVEGWTAIPTRIVDAESSGDTAFSSFCVMDCPEFLEDEPRALYFPEEEEPEMKPEPKTAPKTSAAIQEGSPRERAARKSDPGLPYCKYSLSVLCNRGPDDDCWLCGWNPEVDSERRKNLRKEAS